jgi:hypothetical protein
MQRVGATLERRSFGGGKLDEAYEERDVEERTLRGEEAPEAEGGISEAQARMPAESL